jgi:membrane protein
MNYFKRLYDRYLHSPHRRLLIRYLRKIILPGFDGMPFYDVMKFFFTGIIKGAVTTRASAVSFNFFMALFPAILVLFTLIPYVPIQGFQDSLLATLQNLIPEQIFDSVEETLFDIINRPRGGLLSVGFLLTLYFATNGVSSIIEAFNQTHHTIETRSFLRQQIVSIALVIVLSLLVIVSISLITLGPLVLDWMVGKGILRGRFTIEIIIFSKWLMIVLMLLFIYSFLYYFGPARKKYFRFISAGSTFASLTTILTSIGFNFYVNNFSRYNTLYGSIGTLLVFLLWIYFNSIILLIGFELNASITQVKRDKNKILPGIFRAASNKRE